MKRRLAYAIILIMALIGMLTSTFIIQPVRATSKTWTVDDDGSADFDTIQEAINYADNEDTIFVKPGKYYEHLSVNKPLLIVAEDRDTTIIDGNYTEAVVTITADNVTFENFTIRNSAQEGLLIHSSGIVLFSQFSTIRNNKIINTQIGIYLYSTFHNLIESNFLENSEFYGILLDYSDKNTVSNNIIHGGCFGIGLDTSNHNKIYSNTVTNVSSTALYIYTFVETSKSDHNSLIGNNITDNTNGIWLSSSSNNSIYKNNIRDNNIGISLSSCSNNKLHHNNFINNTQQARTYQSGHTNLWDSGYPHGGNYWSDHVCVGNPSNGSQPYTIDYNNTDHFPFQHPDGWLEIQNIDTGLRYETIQEAINVPETLEGHTILVEEGLYYENVVVNKTLNIIGENPNKTLVDGDGTGAIFHLAAEKISITGFTVQNAFYGIWVDYAHNCTIQDNIFVNNSIGLRSIQTLFCTVHRNFFSNNEHGIFLHGFAGCEISKNLICRNVYGASFYNGYDAEIFENYVKENMVYGLHLQKLRLSTVYGNTIEENGFGLSMQNVWNNDFYHNNIIRNDEQVVFVVYSPRPNRWNTNYEGNYWSNYTGVDSDRDGIGNTPHFIDTDNQDNYPLAGVFSSFNTSLGYTVDIVSNSTIEDFEYFESNSTIKIHLSNMTSNQTHGFCRIRIPHALMNETYHVTVDGVEPYYVNYTLFDDGGSRWIYFSYEHSKLEILIIPEIPSPIILPLFMIVTLLAFTVYRSKQYI